MNNTTERKIAMMSKSPIHVRVTRRFSASPERIKITIAAFVVAMLCGMDALSAQDASKKSAPEKEHSRIFIKLTSVMVNDQDKALKFYTEVLGFVKKTEIPMGEAKWLTVVSPEGPDDIELLLEPMGFPPAKTYQKALFEAGIPLTAFAVEDIQEAYERMKKLGVVFTMAPTTMGPVTQAVFDDTCGNLIQLYQEVQK
jgi:predicted enzyme related to lactoylglutathione lyase